MHCSNNFVYWHCSSIVFLSPCGMCGGERYRYFSGFSESVLWNSVSGCFLYFICEWTLHLRFQKPEEWVDTVSSLNWWGFSSLQWTFKVFGDFLFSFILFLNFMSLWGTFFLWMLSNKIKIYKPHIIKDFFVAQNEGLGGLSYATIGPDMVKTWSLYYHFLLLYMGIWYTKTY